jgi:hypothetical protein
MIKYLDEINPHAALLQSECYVSQSDRDWEAYLAEIARLLGVPDLDGDGDVDGYSIDQAADWFFYPEQKLTAREAADEFKHQIDMIENDREQWA